MKLVNWNIQWSRGVDGVVDPHRIVADAGKFTEFDVLCLQEVAANFPSLNGSKGEDQFEIFAGLLPGYTAVCAFAVDVAGESGRRRFGNMVLSRYPVLRVLRHQLPWPADSNAISMPRVLIEAMLDTPLGPVRVMTTHLEYYSALQRQRQVEALRACHAESCQRALERLGPRPMPDASEAPFLDVAQTPNAILMGDFNFRPEDPLHDRLQQPFENGAQRLYDAWRYLYGNQPHPHSVGVYDRQQWLEPFTCDFLFVSEGLLSHVRRVEVDDQSRSSDHQPLLLELELE